MCGGGGCGTILGAIAGIAAAPFTGGLSLATIAAGATIGGMLFPGKAETPAMPSIPSPAAPAPAIRASNGATVKIGSDTLNQRVSGSRTTGGSGQTSTSDALTGLGRSGLAI